MKPGTVFRDCADCPEMVVIPAGRFTMGSATVEPGHSPDEQPQHVVTFTKPFAVGKFEVTRAEYAAVAAATGSARAKSTILFFLCGGSSHVDLWDMKPEAPLEYRGDFRPVATTAKMSFSTYSYMPDFSIPTLMTMSSSRAPSRHA